MAKNKRRSKKKSTKQNKNLGLIIVAIATSLFFLMCYICIRIKIEGEHHESN